MNRTERYSLDNGLTMTEFAEGEVYAVPGFVAQAMIARGWARAANDEDAHAEDEQGKRKRKAPGEHEVETADANPETGAAVKLKLGKKGKSDD